MSKQQLIEEVFGVDANLYVDALCIDQYASEKEIEKAYLRQWQKTRKELNQNQGDDKQDLVQKKLEALLLAYRILSNSELRKRYDDMLTDVSSKKKSGNSDSGADEIVDDRQSSFSGRGGSENSERRSDDSTGANSSDTAFSARSSDVNTTESGSTLSYGAKIRKAKTKKTSPKPSPKSLESSLRPDAKPLQSHRKNKTKNDSKHDSLKTASLLTDGSGSENFIFDKEKMDENDQDDFSFGENLGTFGVNSSYNSQSTFTTSFDSQLMAANVSSATIQEHGEDDDESVSFKTDDTSVTSDEKKQNFSSRDKQTLESCTNKKKSSSSKMVTFKDDVIRENDASSPAASSLEGDESSTLLDDDGTVGDSTIDTFGESTVGTLDSYYEEDLDKGRSLATDECYDFLSCAPFNKNTPMNKMLQNISEEVRGSFDDTISAMDQVFNAFTIQPDEFSSLVSKIETEKQTFGFSSRFINMAQAEREKRLSESKHNGK